MRKVGEEAMSWQEFPVFVPYGEERLCAVVCTPEGDCHDLGVVLLTGGNYTRSHRNRMWVRAARSLAEHGFPSIRLDYHGVGDSTGHARFDLDVPFDGDVAAAADFLERALGCSRLMLVATCFGGRSAVAAAAALPAVVAATIFEMPVLVPPPDRPASLQGMLKRRILGSPRARALLKHRSVKRLRGRVAAELPRAREVVIARFKQEVVSFVRRGELRLIYGRESEALPGIRRCVAEVEPTLEPRERERIRLELIEGTGPHRFRTLPDQDLAVDQTVASVCEIFELLESRPAATRQPSAAPRS
ncbi:MAG: alpha/beta fold hydrolase [Actinomycetota bacterium]